MKEVRGSDFEQVARTASGEAAAHGCEEICEHDEAMQADVVVAQPQTARLQERDVTWLFLCGWGVVLTIAAAACEGLERNTSSGHSHLCSV